MNNIKLSQEISLDKIKIKLLERKLKNDPLDDEVRYSLSLMQRHLASLLYNSKKH